MDWLLDLDRDLLLGINGAHTGWLDTIMYWVSNKYVWIPAYALLLYALYRWYGWKQTAFAVGAVGLMILIADQSASGILKPLVERMRPCHDPEIGHLVHRVHNKCGGQFGFVSSHAANFFALATFMGNLFRRKWKWWPVVFIACAGLVAYSRVYLGVHYPGDVLGGAIVGVLAALISIVAFRFATRQFLPDSNNSFE